MTDTTPRLGLPCLHAGQAQKEWTHNEALQRLDMCVQPVVEDVRDAPPASPQEGLKEGVCWLVSATPTGAWTGHAKAVTQWTAGGWRFVEPFDGLQVFHKAAGGIYGYFGGNWSGIVSATGLRIGGAQVVGARGAAILPPSGGSVADTECRTSVAAIIAALQAHGLISN